MTKTVFAFTVAAVLSLGGLTYTFLARHPDDRSGAGSASGRVWTEMRWPFPLDAWGQGKAFRCRPKECGEEINLYLRAKMGFCNCTTGVVDDDDLERMSDLDLVGSEVSPLKTGRAIIVGSMRGRTRAYELTGRDRPSKDAISVVFNERCDMVVATVVLPRDRLTTSEPAVLEFLNSRTVLQWVELTLGL